ncbi:MAG: cation-translocating P-type ATPase [Thermodesulfobacteriota bacterium]
MEALASDRPDDGRCRLCGLERINGSFPLVISSGEYQFCCNGCRQVFRMLSETGTSVGEVGRSEVLEKCRTLGIIPRSEQELKESGKPDIPKEKGNPSGSEHRLNLDLLISGMWCPACAWLIGEAARKQPGIEDVVCRFSTDQFLCRYDPVCTSPGAVIRFIEGLGYRAVLRQDGDSETEDQREWIRLIICVFLTMNVMMFSFSLYFGFFSRFSEETIRRLSFPVAVLSSLVLVYGGKEIFRKAIRGVSAAAFGVETLISIGSLAAYGFSTYQFLSGSIELYYDTSAMLITLLLLGKRLEAKGRRRISKDLSLLFSLVPTKVKICTDRFPQGRYAPVAQLKTGDCFIVSEEESVAADGVVIQGDGFVDESSLTGEAKPVRKQEKDRLTAGSRVISGGFRVRTEAVGNASFLGRMISVMEEALSRRNRFEERSEHLLRWFIPGIVGLAVMTGVAGILWGIRIEEAITRSISMVVISCPCALGIAVPLAHVAGLSLGLRNGILIRDFRGVMNSRGISLFVFDKTGTVTEGKWRLMEIKLCSGLTEKMVLGLAFGLERSSSHYIALEIKQCAESRGIEPLTVTGVELYENGISGRHLDATVKIGSREFLKKEILDSTAIEPDQKEPGRWEEPESTHSSVYMSYNGSLCAWFRFEDVLKEGVAEAVEGLKKGGYGLVLVSGDSSWTTEQIGRRIGIRKVYGGQLPLEKVKIVDELQKNAGPVAMVGDGINDAPAMLQADLSVAMNSGAHFGKEASHIVLMRNDLRQISVFMNIADRVQKKIRQNLAWAFAYNAAGIPLAAFGFLNPIFAASAMLMSSLSIIGNTLLLIKK